MKWMNENSGALSVLTTVVLVAVTVVYVVLTGRLSRHAGEQLKEAQLARLDGRMPTVTARTVVTRVAAGVVQIDLEIANTGTIPASIFVACPLGWTPPVASDPYEPTSVYATLPPQERMLLKYGAPIDPSVPIATAPPLTHLQHLNLDLEVSPLEGGVLDEYSWGVTYDPAVEEMHRDVPKFFLHERRRYPGLVARDS